MFLIKWMILRFNFDLCSYMMIAMNMRFSLLCVCAWSSLVIAGSDDHDKSCYEPVLVDASNELGGSTPTLLKIVGDLAYVINNHQQDLVILDLSLPGFEVLSRTTGFTRLNDIVIHDQTAYLTTGDEYSLSEGGVSIWDIEDPADPWFIRNHETFDNFSKLLIDDGLMYKSNELVLNVARQRALKVEHSYGESVYSRPIARVVDAMAITYAMEIVDLTDPANPVVVFDDNYRAEQVSFAGRYIYARGISSGSSFSNEIRLYEMVSATELVFIQDYSTLGTDFVVRGSMLYITENDGLTIVDWSNPQRPYEIATHEEQIGLSIPTQIELVDDVFYLTDLHGTISAYRFPSHLVGSHVTDGAANELVLVGDLALVAMDGAGMQIFDVSEPQMPVLLSTFNTGNDAVGIDAKDEVVYIAAHQAGLDIVDISDPMNPTLLSNFDTGRSVQDVQVVGDLAYVMDRINGLHILDVADPSLPILLSITDTPTRGSDITIVDQDGLRYAVIPHESFDLQILDVTDASSPMIIGSITPLDGNNGIDAVTFRGGLMYTGENSDGYRVWDFADPSNPIELATINTDVDSQTGFGHHLVFDGSLMVLANGSGGLSVYHNADPRNPVRLSAQPTIIGLNQSSYRRVELRDGLAYTTARDGGLRIFDYRGCDEPCFVDFNLDGVLNFLDISIFLDGFNNDEALADINADGMIDFFDVLELINAFRNGCP